MEEPIKEAIFKKFLDFFQEEKGQNGMVDWQQIKASSRLAKIGLNNKFIDREMLILLDILCNLETYYHIKITAEEIFSFSNVNDIIENIWGKIQQQ